MGAVLRNLPELRARTVSGCAAAAVLALALAGCTALPAPAPTPASTPLASPIATAIPVKDLVGAWHLTEFSTDGVATEVPDARDTLFVFDNGRLVEKSHCAAFNGYYVPTDGTLTLRNDVGARTGCMSNVIPGNVMSTGFTMHLSDDDTLTLTSTTIELKKPDPEKFRPASVYTYERSSTDPGEFPPLSTIELPAPPIPVEKLVGEWKLTEYVTVGGTRVTVNDRGDSVLFFTNGRLYDTALCDTFRGDYTEGDGTLYFTNEITNQLECYNPTGSGHVWASGVRMYLDGDELRFESTTARDPAAPDQATYDDAAQIFTFHRVSGEPGAEPKY